MTLDTIIEAIGIAIIEYIVIRVFYWPVKSLIKK